MADFPEFTDEFTHDMKMIIVGGRVHIAEEPLPSFDPTCPVGTICHWDEERVIVRVSEHSWQFSKKVDNGEIS